MTEQQLRSLLDQMTLQEKIGQLVQLDGGCFGAGDVVTGPMAKLGVTQTDVDVCGSVLNVLGAEKVRAIQDTYLQRSRLKIPLLFMADVIYGYQTCFPIPLALGATWDPDLIRSDYELIAREASADGCMVTFSPPVDIVRDARWGRCLEMPGEDPVHTARFAKAMVEGFQNDWDTSHSIASCVKHFAAYGAPEAGREYNTVDMSERRLRQDYLPGYKAAIDAGAVMVMTSFNTIDEIPSTANKWLLCDVLRKEWGFDGITITDYAAIKELIYHGVAADEREASALAMSATVDIDMKTVCYAHQLEPLVKDGVLDENQIDTACMRVLRLKNQLGLFEDPYRGCSVERRNSEACSPDKLAAARKTCNEAMVLLKNDGVLPLAKRGQKIALIGPYADSQDIIGMWAIHAKREHSVTVRAAMAQMLGEDSFVVAKGCEMLDDYRVLGEFASIPAFNASLTDQATPEVLEAEALTAAAQADVIIMALGEHMLQSGEAGARTDITLPAQQKELLHKVRTANPGKPLVLVLFNGRPLALSDVLTDCDAILEAWFPGTAGGQSVCDVLFGDCNPSGRLSISFPHNVGQLPLYYAQFSTGRPEGGSHNGRFVSKYLDCPNTALFPFGYGLSYHTAEYGAVSLDKPVLTGDETITASITVKNTGAVPGIETVQLYLRDLVGSVVRPIKELKDWQKVSLAPGESKTVAFTITEKMLRFYNKDITYKSEPGAFKIFIGPNSADLHEADFILQ